MAPPLWCCEVISFFFSFSSGLPADWQGEPHIAIKPEPQTVRPGADITLRCAAFGIPTPHYQWYRNGQELADGTGDTLQVNRDCLLTVVPIASAYTVTDGLIYLIQCTLISHGVYPLSLQRAFFHVLSGLTDFIISLQQLVNMKMNIKK